MAVESFPERFLRRRDGTPRNLPVKERLLVYKYPWRLRLTIRMEIAAGVTPEILEAWPRE